MEGGGEEGRSKLYFVIGEKNVLCGFKTEHFQQKGQPILGVESDTHAVQCVHPQYSRICFLLFQVGDITIP